MPPARGLECKPEGVFYELIIEEEILDLKLCLRKAPWTLGILAKHDSDFRSAGRDLIKE